MDDPHQLLDDLIRRNLSSGMPDADRPARYSDDTLALGFTERHGSDLRYVAVWGRWLIWNGRRWASDETQRAVELAREVGREASIEVLAGKGSMRLAASVASAKTIGAIERLARADHRHAATVDEWDRDPWLVNTPDETIDLRTGKGRAHHRDDRITKMTTVAPGGACPLWLSVLDRIFKGDAELIAFVQRMFGYTLTGSIRDHALFFLHGSGGNGKGVLLNTWSSILGDYAVTAAMETFTASQGERHPTDLAMLRGARVVMAQETEEGQRWAEARIKALTGGDPISVRFMRQDFFTFTPNFKLVIAGNHKPSLRSVDEAVKRRFNLIPFTETIPEAERDPKLAEKLREEWPGILAWGIAGCLEWQRIGLAPPPSVRAATENYLSDEDTIGQFLIERCALGDATVSTEVKLLFAALTEWSGAAGEGAMSVKRFSQALANRGLHRGKHHTTRRAVFEGVRLLSGMAP